MKKKLIGIFGILTVLVCLLTLVACDGKGKEEVSFKTTSYNIDLKLDDNRLECVQTMSVNNKYGDGISELVLMLYPNAYSESATAKAYIEKPSRYGGIEVTYLGVNGAETDFKMGEDNQSLNFGVTDWQKGADLEIKLNYIVELPECDLRFGTKDGYYNLSNFYPQLACFDGESFRCDKFCTVGDPIMSDVADFCVKADIPENLVAACAGEVSAVNTADGRKTFTVTGKNMRDFAMVLNADYKVFNGVYNDVTINYYTTDATVASERVALTVNAVKTFSETFGDYPYSTFTVAETPFASDGMEFSGLVYIAADATDAEEAIIHETAHQWWYNMVGNDNINSAYLDEGLTTFTTAYYYLLNGDEPRYSAEIKDIESAYMKYERLQKIRGENGMVNMNKSIYFYSDYQYTMLVYYKGCLMFKNLYDTLGATKFNKALRLYVESNKFGWADKEKLCASFGKAYGGDVSGLIDGWLSDSAVLTMFVA